MKNVIAITAVLFSIFSCQKEQIKQDTKQDTNLGMSELSLQQRNNTLIYDTVYSQQYNFSVYDSCTMENIDMGGLETYKLKETGPSNEGYFIYYEIDLTHIVGTGEKSGTKYHGGGVIKSMVKEKDKFSRLDTTIEEQEGGVIDTTIDSIFVRAKEIARDTYRTKYTSNHDEITFTMKDVYKELHGVIVIENTGNPIMIVCRTF